MRVAFWAIACLFAFVSGITMAVNITSRMAVEYGCLQYNAKSGGFEWGKEPK